MTWERTFATYVVANRNTIQSIHRPWLWHAMVRDELLHKVVMALWEHGWPHEWLRRAGAPPITLSVTDSHADAFIRNQVVILAECRALDLLNPNPLPDMSLWRRRRRR